MLRLHNSLTGRIEEFTPQDDRRVRMYNCGPTVYRRNHVGNYRAYMLADLLRRSLTFLGYDVHQIMNITDVGHLTDDDVADARGEDKLQAEARRQGVVDPYEIARRVEGWFHEDRKALRIQDAERYPRATDHVPEMIEMIEALIEKGHAYEVGGNVYFDVGSFAPYGALSGNTVEQLAAGAGGRVEERGDKKSPHDFALWKRDEKHLMQWDSPWGRGFPGWHIECSAMSRKYLGDTIDIHTGGPDNKFPHHECEIAQSECVTGHTFVRYWLHCGRLEIGGRKMSKREGTLYTIPDLLEEGFDGADVRLFLLRHHYRSPLPFDLDGLRDAAKTRAKLDNFVSYEMENRPEGPSQPAVGEAIARARKGFREALEDDLNTSVALAVIHELMTTINRLAPSRDDAQAAIATMREFDRIFDVLDAAPRGGEDDAEIDALVAERDAARAARDFARADAIRDELASRGIEVLDGSDATRWRRR